VRHKRRGLLLAGIVALVVVVQAGVFVMVYENSYAQLPDAEKAPAVSSGEQTHKTLAAFDSDERSAFAALYPREAQVDRDQVWAHCAVVSPAGRVIEPVEAASPSHTRVVLDGFAKNDPGTRVSCTFWLTWRTGDGPGYWSIVWQGS
jgi:hypothetical protein